MKLNNAKPDWDKIARQVLRSRYLDRLEVEKLTPEGEIKYQFSAMGHELAQVLLADFLNHPHDAATVYYRSRPFVLAAGLSLREALLGGFALSGGTSEGRDAGVMFNLPGDSHFSVLPSSGGVGSQYTPAAGWAQAIIYHQSVLEDLSWSGAIAVALGGDGSVAANGFWSALNIVTTLNLPYLFFIEDNRYGLSVPSDLQTPGGDIASNLSSYGNLHILSGDGTQPEETWELIREAVAHVRSGEGPCLLRLRVPRLLGHTFIDNQKYKDPKEREAEASRDPVKGLREFLLDHELVTRESWANLKEEIGRELATALESARGSDGPDPEQVNQNIFYQGESPLQGGLRPEGVHIPLGSTESEPQGARVNFVDAIRRTLEVEMRLNPRMLVFGEDVGVKGGVHGATMDMQTHFGEDRVFDTSLSEEGIVGRAVGMALAGLLPVPEIQFRKYADPAHEQISDLGTIRWRSANRFAAPVVIRIPVGYGKVTGDPWHSVSGEAIFAHLPGWRLAYPSNTEDAVGLLRSALRGDDPTFFFEHRDLLDTPAGRRPYPGDEYCTPFGQAKKLIDGDELTLITWGAMVPRCFEVAQDFPGQVSLLDLRTIIPWDKERVLESVRRTGKVLVVHEDTHTAGFGGEILATIASKAFIYLDAPLKRLATSDIPIPYNIRLMESTLPSVDRIRKEVKEILEF